MKPDEPYKPLLSIIIPMYNVEKYIKFCINSVIKNDISDVEILIVNDGSTDSSRTIMEKYQSEYSQIRVYDKKNEGVSSARNYGLMKSKGDWVWFIDSDDAINQGSLKYIKKEISDRNNKFDILVFKYLKFKRNSDVSKINDIKIPNEAKAISKFQAMKSLLDNNIAAFPWNKIFKKSLFDKIKFPEDRIYTEDLSIMYKLYDKASSIYFQSAPFYFYRIRNDSLTHNLSTKKIKDAALSHYEMYSFFKENYPTLAIKLERNTMINVISLFHRLNKEQILLYPDLIEFLTQNIKITNYDIRYKIECLSFKKCYPIFVIIGRIGKISRKIRNYVKEEK